MIEEVSTVGLNSGIQPDLHIWGMEVAVYLYLGGLVAGLMILSGIFDRKARNGAHPPVEGIILAPLLAPVLLSLGMGGLFLDLERKAHFFHFYTTFQVASPMSWGSWILLLVFPAQFLFIAHRLDVKFPGRQFIGAANIVLGAALGVYTGILLSTLGARPLWNTPLLGPLFLISGLSTATALLALLEPTEQGKHWLGSLDLKLIGAEGAVLVLMMIGLFTGGAVQRSAAGLLFGGAYTAVFWALVVVIGLLVPVALEVAHRRGRAQATAYVPILVLVGGFALRAVILLAGQASGWEA
jgi:formate-dependent nitrite reductase membrane component NrfD